MKLFNILITCVMIVLFSSMSYAEGNEPLNLNGNKVADIFGFPVSTTNSKGSTVYNNGVYGLSQEGNLNIEGNKNTYHLNGEINGKIGENGIVSGTAGIDGAMIGNDEICSKCTFELDLNSGEFKMTPPDNNDVFFRRFAISDAKRIEVSDINDPNSKIQVIGENAMIMDPSRNSFSGKNPTNNPANQKFSGENGYYVGENFDGKKTSDCWGKCTMSFEPMDENAAIGFIESHQKDGSAAVVFNVKDKDGFYHGGRSTTTVERNGLNTKTIIPSQDTIVQRDYVSSPKESIKFDGNGYISTDVRGESVTNDLKIKIEGKKLKFAANKNPFTKPNSNKVLEISEFDITANGEKVIEVRNNPDFAEYVRTGDTLPEKSVEVEEFGTTKDKKKVKVKFKTPGAVVSEATLYGPQGAIVTNIDLSLGWSGELVRDSYRDLAFITGLEGEDYLKVLEGIDTLDYEYRLTGGHESSIILKPKGEIAFVKGLNPVGDEPGIQISPESVRKISREIMNPIIHSDHNEKIKQFLKQHPEFDYTK